MNYSVCAAHSFTSFTHQVTLRSALVLKRLYSLLALKRAFGVAVSWCGFCKHCIAALFLTLTSCSPTASCQDGWGVHNQCRRRMFSDTRYLLGRQALHWEIPCPSGNFSSFFSCSLRFDIYACSFQSRTFSCNKTRSGRLFVIHGSSLPSINTVHRRLSPQWSSISWYCLLSE